MNSSHDKQANERLIMGYIEAVEAGQLERIGHILQMAETSPSLLLMIEEVNEAFFEDLSSCDTPVPRPYTQPDLTLLREPKLGEPDDKDISRERLQPINPTPDVAPSQSNIRQRWAWGAAGLACLGLLMYLLPYPLLQPSPPALSADGLAQCTRPSSPITAKGASPSTPQGAAHPKAPASWIEVVHHQPDRMLQMLTSGDMHLDLLALRENQRLSTSVARQFTPAQLTPAHRAIRARLNLRMARFHLKNYTLALSFHHAVYRRRLDRAKSLHLGRKFQYYWGRLLCLQGKYKQASRALAIAAQTAPATRQDRIKAWQLACQTPQPAPQALQHALARLSFRNDPEGWAEWYLIHHLHGLTPAHTPKSQDPRTALYAKVLQRSPVQWPEEILRLPIESEQIEERGIQAQLTYYDPTVFLMMGRDYAQRALRLLQRAPAKDLYAAFYRAEAHRMLGQEHRARKELVGFLQHIPQEIDGSYLFFSHRLSPTFMQKEACYHLAMDPKTTPTQARHILRRLGQQGHEIRSLAGLGLIERKINPQLGYQWLNDGVHQAQEITERLHKHFWLASVQERKTQRRRGAQIVAQLGLYRYQVRALYLWGSMGAVQMDKGDQATRWLEMLHRKHVPYKITGENEPLQFAWTARAYLGAGRPGVASLFLSKNLAAYPSLTQLWDLLRVWRIYEGMDSVPLIKG